MFLKKVCAMLTTALAGASMIFTSVLPTPVFAEESSSGDGTEVTFNVVGDGSVTIADELQSETVYGVYTRAFPEGEDVSFTYYGDLQSVTLDGKEIEAPENWKAKGGSEWTFTFADPETVPDLGSEWKKSYPEKPTKDERIAIAKELGIEDQLDDDGYLPITYWQSQDAPNIKMANRADYKAICRPGTFEVNAEDVPEAASLTRDEWIRISSVKNYVGVLMPWGPYYFTNCLFTMTNGATGFCGNGLAATPGPGNNPISPAILVTDQTSRKMLYYGYKGPKNQLTNLTEAQQIIITDELISYANTGHSIGVTLYPANKPHVLEYFNKLKALPNPPDSYKVYRVEYGKSPYPSSQGGLYLYQPVFYGVDAPVGKARLVKEPTDNVSADFFEGNPLYPVAMKNGLYGVAGARFGLYKTEADAKNDTNRIGNFDFQLSDKGASNTIGDLIIGDHYFVKEVIAPDGFEINNAIYKIFALDSWTSDWDYWGPGTFDFAPFLVKDTPLASPVSVVIRKENDSKQPLADAEFTMKFYGAYFDTADEAAGKTPLKTWVFKTDSNGEVKLEDSYKVSGDSLYTLNNKPVLPLGTVTIEETKAPDGYEKSDTVLVQQIKQDSKGVLASWQVQTVVDKSDLPGVTIVKRQAGTSVTIPGVVFEHTMPDGTVEKITTAEDGTIVIPQAALGTHKLKEVSVPAGYQLSGTEITFEVDKNGIVEGSVTNASLESGDLIVDNAVSDFDINLIKRDQSQKELPGAEFTLYSDPELKTVVATGVTDENGFVDFGSLKNGSTYYLKETKAPDGFLLPENNDAVSIYVNMVPAKKEYTVKIDGEDSDSYAIKDDGTLVVNVSRVNQASGLLPDTGSSLPMLILLGGIALALIGVVSIGRKSRI